jgi:ABC-type branched-subunit amino acid transport system ATPase component
MSALLETRVLSKSFGHFVANDRIDFTVEAGEVRAVIGPNGAGKTTFFNVLAGVTPATAGAIAFAGADVTHTSGQHRVRLGIAKAFQTANIYSDASVLQNCRLAALAHVTGPFTAQMFRRSQRLHAVDEIAHEALDRVELGGAVASRAGDLSHGDKKRLDIAIALATRPKLLLLDEPVAGMSKDEARKTEALVRKLAASMTVLIIEHDMEMIMGISDSITVLHQGKLLATGTPAEIRGDARVQEAYLGGHAGEQL